MSYVLNEKKNYTNNNRAKNGRHSRTQNIDHSMYLSPMFDLCKDLNIAVFYSAC